MCIRLNVLPQWQLQHKENQPLREHNKHLSKCKDAMWKRWTNEYLCGLWEWHNLMADLKGELLL